MILVLTNFTSNRYSVPSGSRADLRNEAQGGPKGQVLQYFMVDRNMEDWSCIPQVLSLAPEALKQL